MNFFFLIIKQFIKIKIMEKKIKNKLLLYMNYRKENHYIIFFHKLKNDKLFFKYLSRIINNSL